MKLRKSLFLLYLIVPTLLFAVRTEVRLLSGGEDQFRSRVEQVLTEVLNGLNKNHDSGIPLERVKQHFSIMAYREFKELVKSTKIYASQKQYQTYLISKNSGYFEVRNLKVRVYLGGTAGIPFQNLVFIFNASGQIESSHFSIEKHHYQDIIDQGKKLKDIANREKILHFIELYRTAYNKKDIDFIEKTLSDDALIIVGHVIKTQNQEVDYLNSSYLSDEKINFIRLGKSEYIANLKKVMKKNDFIRILFDQITIQRHPQIEQVYGVQLKQRWHSSRYSDEGYIFLLVDFIQPDEPIIHVRAWQPDKFSDGSTISIYDFEIIE